MLTLPSARRNVRARWSRSLALLLSLLLFTTALPSGSLSRVAHTAPAPPTDSSNRGATENTAPGDPQASTPDEATQARLAEAYGKLSLSFEANRGQTGAEVKFLARGSGYSLFLTSTEAVMVLTKPAASKDKNSRAKSSRTLEAELGRPARMGAEREAASRVEESGKAEPETTVLRMKLEGASSTPQVEGLDELPGKTNYFIGNDPAKWHVDVPSYARVMYRNVYPGIDMVYYGKQQQLEYDFIVAPGVDPASIKLAFDGAESITLDAQGDLVLHTAGGDVRQHKPVVYQEIDGAKREIPSRYVMQDAKRVGFQVDAYDRSKPLVIDPVLSYSTYLGGSGLDEGEGIAVDAAGNAYVSGSTTSTDFPQVNPVDTPGTIPLGNNFDVFVTKLKADGSAFVYSTYLGGASTERGLGIALDPRGFVYVTGFTFSADFPTAHPLQASLKGKDDAFVVKLTPSGSALTYSTYLGGLSFDGGHEVTADAGGNAYLTGFTFSHDFPTAHSFQPIKHGDQAFKSTNSGGDWNVSDTGLNAARMNGVAIDPDNPATLYVATELGIFKSTDSGGTWNMANTGLGNINEPLGVPEARTVNVNPVNTSTVWAGTVRGLFKSTNGGNSWTINLPSSDILALAIDPQNPSIIYASLGGTLWKTTDGGNNWDVLRDPFDPNSPTFITDIAITPTQTSTIYAVSEGSVYKSTDGGNNWVLSNGPPFFTLDVVVDPSDPSIVYAGTGGVYKSTNGGIDWSESSTGFPTMPSFIEVYVLAIDPLNPSVIYAGTTGSGIFKSTNSGGTWVASQTGLTNSAVRDIEIDPTTTSNVYAVTNSLGDGFVTKLNPNGSAILYSTYLGGNESDEGNGVAVDGEGNAYLTGETFSTDFPVEHPLQVSLASANSFSSDAFVTKLDASGTNISYSTYLGSTGDDQGLGIAVDSAGNAYATGDVLQFELALPMNFPTTPGAFRPTFIGNSDAFVTKINAAGTNFVYSTFLGGSNTDIAQGIAVNSLGQAFVSGLTRSEDFPIVGATQPLLRALADAFVTRLNANGSALVFSTYLGGNSSSEMANDIAIDADSSIYVIGNTRSINFPTINAVQETRKGPVDAFVTKFGPALSAVEISGRVTLPNGTGLGGVTITLTDGPNFTPRTVITRSDGLYRFTDVPAGRNYTLTPSKFGYSFTPMSRSLTNVRTNVSFQNFTAVLTNFTIQGKVSGINDVGIAGVKLMLTGSRKGSFTTTASGFYSFSVPAGGDYTITPLKGGLKFKPVSRTFNNVTGNVFNANFEAFASISGRVTKIHRSGYQGVTVKLSGSRTATTVTDIQGHYSFDDLPAGGNYTVTPSKTGVTFNPPSASFNNLNTSPIANFEALVSITGKVRITGTATGLSGVKITLSGSRSASTTTDANGFYTFSNLPAGGNYTVTPSKMGYTFNPPSRTFNNMNVSKTVSMASFDATPN